MWKKMGTVKQGESHSARSHLTKQQQPFQLFYGKNLAVPTVVHKNNFCQQYMNRHHSADKQRTYHQSQSHSDHSLLVPTESAKPEAQLNQDTFSVFPGKDLVKKKSSLQVQSMPDNNLTILQQKLKKYRDKWHQTHQKLLNLKKKHSELKTEVTAELDKWKQQVQKAFGELTTQSAVRKAETVQVALKSAKQYREDQQRWRRQQKDILQRFNKTLQRLI